MPQRYSHDSTREDVLMPIQAKVAQTRASRIYGIGSYRPVRVVDNEYVAQKAGLDPEWIEKRSGIRTRRYAGPEETVAAMGMAAAAKALARAGVDPADIGSVVVATTTHLTQMPALAPEIAQGLGATNASAFDISAACAGFCHALAIGNDMVRAGTTDYVLVIGSERVTDIFDETDKATAFLFADGAGAVVIGPSQRQGIGPVVWGADGNRLDVIGMTGFWTPELRSNPESPWPRLGMTGWRVYRWATEELVPALRRALDLAGVGPADLQAFIPHQANMLITQTLARALQLPDTVAISDDITQAGNTSAASIPLAMDDMLTTGKADQGGLALIVGFGSGLVYAAQVVEMP
jgi:3-oxoacyl-(acyl-carrier-protein) synthase III